MYQNEYRGKQTTDSTETMFSIVPLGACTYRHMSDDDVFHLNVNRLEKGLVSREYPVFYASDDNNLDFIVQQINSSAEFRSFCAEQKKGGTRTRLYYKNLCEFQMLIPNTEEQEKIATFLLTLDTLITLHQREYFSFDFGGGSAKNVQKTLSWEQRKFNELAETRRGLTYKPSDVREDGVRVLRSSNIDEDTFIIDENDVFVDRSTINIPFVRTGDILITSANGSSRLVGKHAVIREIPDNSAVHGGFMLLASAKNPQFVNALMGAPWYTKFINLFVAGGNGAIGNLNKNDLDEQTVLVPSELEQEMIGDFFAYLDTLITLHQHKPNKKGHDVLTVMPFKGNQRKPHYLCT